MINRAMWHVSADLARYEDSYARPLIPQNGGRSIANNPGQCPSVSASAKIPIVPVEKMSTRDRG